MKSTSYHFQWFEREDHRKPLRASVSKEGKLRLGRTLRKTLPSNIRIGFDSKRKVLAIADGHGAGVCCPKCGIITAQELSCQISALGLGLPVSFLITRDHCTGYFLGRIVPRRRAIGNSGQEYDVEQLLILYQHIIDDAVCQLAKSTPPAERREMAVTALVEGMQSYLPGYGDLETYLREQVRMALIRENRQNVSECWNLSLDSPLTNEEGNTFCLYDTTAVSDDGGLSAVEDRIMAEQFLKSLSAQERKLVKLLRSGLSLSRIADRLQIGQEDMMRMGEEIAQKRREFYALV